MAPADITGSVPATPVSLGAAAVWHVPELEGNPMPLGWALPAVTDDDLAAVAQWLDDPGLRATVQASVLNLSWHTYVIRVGDSTALVDTGLGNGKRREAPIAFADGLDTGYLSRLAALGITPGDVNVVICTHLHFDHVGWNTCWDGDQWIPTFPRARYLFPQQDFDYFAAGGDPVSGAAFADSVLPVMRSGQAHLIGDGHVAIDDGSTKVWLASAAGHTPGSLLVRLDGAGQRAVFCGDVIHHPIQLVRPELSLAVEEHPEVAAKVRRDLLEAIADTGTLLCPAHFRGTPAGYVERHGSGFRWQPVSADTEGREE